MSQTFSDDRENEWQLRLKKGRAAVDQLSSEVKKGKQLGTEDIVTLGQYYFDAYVLPFLLKSLDENQTISPIPGRHLPGTLAIDYGTSFERTWLGCASSLALRFKNSSATALALVDLLVSTLLTHPDWQVRFRAANVLRAIKDERALPGLRKATSDPEPDVSDESREALQEIELGPRFEIGEETKTRAAILESESSGEPDASQLAAYRAIVETCQESQKAADQHTGEMGALEAICENQPYESLWRGYSERITGTVQLRQADFSGLLFNRARFDDHTFIECDFSSSRWIFSTFTACRCTKCTFAGVNGISLAFENTDCTECDFTNAELSMFDPFGGQKYENANFTDAEIKTDWSFFKGHTHPSGIFKNATMDGCRLVITLAEPSQSGLPKSELALLVEKMFSPDQLRVMSISYQDPASERDRSEASGCFIATAACGPDSRDVAVLRKFRDTVLLRTALGRMFVRTYYCVSPPLASLVSRSPITQNTIRKILIRPIVWLLGRDRKQPSTPWSKPCTSGGGHGAERHQSPQ